MQRAFKSVVSLAVEGNNWTKFANPTAGRGLTAYPKKPADQERICVRFDYDGVISKGQDGEEYHNFEMQPNAGNIPSSFEGWGDASGGTHSVVANVLVKKGATKGEVEGALKDAVAEVSGA